MSRLVKALKLAFQKMESRRWDTVYIFVDMHETVVEPTWSKELATTLYPKAEPTLQMMSAHPNVKLILWSSSLPETNLEYQKFFLQKGIRFSAINSNPFEGSTVYADFDTKPYMSLILDDKAGFQPSDWEELHDYFVMMKALNLLKAMSDGASASETGAVNTFLDDLHINLKYGY